MMFMSLSRTIYALISCDSASSSLAVFAHCYIN